MMKKIVIVLTLFCSGSILAMALAEWVQTLEARGKAIGNGDWSLAVDYSQQLLIYDRDDTKFLPTAPITVVTDYMYLFFCSWNAGNKTFARDCLREGVAFMSSRLGNDCASRAKVLLAKVEAGELSGRFSSNDILGSAGICNFILELPRAVADRRHAALMNQIQASTDVYRKNGEWQAAHAKFHARREYENKYHRSFDPNDRPPEGSDRREDWDSCKRIYDIFEAPNGSSQTTTYKTSSTARQPSSGNATVDMQERLKKWNNRGLQTGTDTLSEAKKCFDCVDQSFDSILSKSAKEIRLAPGEDIAAAIGRAPGRTTIRLQAGRYVLGGDNGTCVIGDKIRIIGAGQGKTVVAGNFTVKSSGNVSLVLKGLTLTGPLKEKDGKLEVKDLSAVFFDDVELKCAIEVECDGYALGRNIKQSLVDSHNRFWVDSYGIFKDCAFSTSSFNVSPSSRVAFEKCIFMGRKHPGEYPRACFAVYGDPDRESFPLYVLRSRIVDFDLVFKSFTAKSDPRLQCIILNDVLLKNCTSVVDGGTCKAYGLKMKGMDANKTSVVNVDAPLDIPREWRK